MRTEGSRGVLLSTLVIASLMVPAISLSQMVLVQTGATLAELKEKKLAGEFISGNVSLF